VSGRGIGRAVVERLRAGGDAVTTCGRARLRVRLSSPRSAPSCVPAPADARAFDGLYPTTRLSRVRAMRLRLLVTAASLVMSSTALVACGDDEPAVCGSAEQLQSSFDDLKDIDLTETNGLEEFKSELETIDGDLDQLTNDAKSEFSSQVDAVTSSFEALGASVQAATADPTADTLAVAKTAMSEFSTSVQALISDVESTC
jgi:hypothetical protein